MTKPHDIVPGHYRVCCPVSRFRLRAVEVQDRFQALHGLADILEHFGSELGYGNISLNPAVPICSPRGC